MQLPDFSCVQSAFEMVRPVLERCTSPERTQRLAERLVQKAEDMTPTIMVFGVYNAGKSTLLNALMGQDLAPTADRPETFEVISYQWNGFSLLDTPGIDAPVEHEAVTRDQLAKSEAILFVVAAGGASEELATWTEVVRIAESGRRIIVIVNNKIGLDESTQAFARFQEKVQSNLQVAAVSVGAKDILSKVPIRLVNAKAGMKAKIEGKNALLVKSGLPQLESDLYDFLSQSTAFDVWNTCRKDLEKEIDLAFIEVREKLSGGDDLYLTDLRKSIDTAREGFLQALNSHLDSAALNARKEATGIIGNADSEMQLEVDLQALSERLGGSLSLVAEEELEKISRNLSAIGEFGSSQLRAGHFSPEGVEIPEHGNAGAKGNFLDTSSIRGQIKNIPIPLEELAKDGVIKAMKFGKEKIPSMFKGIGPVKMGKFAKGVGTWIGPALDVIFGILEYYQAKKAEEQERMIKERREQAINDGARRFAEDLKIHIRKAIREFVNEMFAPLEKSLVEAETRWSAESSATNADLKVLEKARILLQLP